VDILDYGVLELPHAVMARLVVVAATVRAGFGRARGKQTARIVGALDDAHVNVLAQPLGRVVGEGEAYYVDML